MMLISKDNSSVYVEENNNTETKTKPNLVTHSPKSSKRLFSYD